MRNRRESRRTVAQFLNGLAVATVVAGGIAPMANGYASFIHLVISATVGLALLGLAVRLSQLP